MKMVRYTVRRLLWLIPVIIGVSIIAFIITRALPSDPIKMLLGDNTSQEVKDMMRAKLGLDQPLFIQYFYYMRDLLTFDMGVSYTTNSPVTSDLMLRLPATLELIVVSLTLSVVVGVILGALAAINRNSVLDYIVRFFSLLGTIMPTFWIGLLLIYAFFYLIPIFPAPMGRLPMGAGFEANVTGFMLIDTLIAGRGDLFGQALRQMALPVITLAFTNLAAITKLTRSSMIASINTEYTKMSRASGVPTRTVYGKYALKNGLLPVITSVGMTFSYSIGGIVMVEKIFSWPGIGLYAVNALSRSDYPAIQGFVLLCAVIYLIVFLITDLLYFAVDPRIKY